MWITYIINNHSTIRFSCGSLLRLGTLDTMAVVDHFSARFARLDKRQGRWTGPTDHWAEKHKQKKLTTKNKGSDLFKRNHPAWRVGQSPLGLKVCRKFNPKCVEEKKHLSIGNTSKSQPKIPKKHVQRQPTNTTITSSPKPTTPVLIWETQTCRFWSEGGSPVVGWVYS